MLTNPARSFPQVPPFFLAGHLALDFLNSYATPDGQPVEWIGDGKAFTRWYQDAGLAIAADVRATLAGLHAEELDAVAARARALRESIRSALRALGTARKNSQLRTLLNGWMERGSGFRRLEVADGDSRLVEHDRCDDAEQLLVPIATATARLLVEEDLERVRICDGSGCSLWFLDRTKSGTRRFCSAATCGNRAKVAAFRARKQAPPKRPR